MNDRQEIRMVRSEREVAVDIVTSLMALAVVCYALDPTIAEKVRSWVAVRTERFAHAMSVWSTRQSIRSLPETDES